MNLERARSFLYQNARPLDIARWKFLFENGSREEVAAALAVYQNEDGGFGHGLEPDCWNPDSSPVQTWAAAEIVKEIGLTGRDHPLVRGLLRYLASGASFDGHTWANTIASNSEHPHAPWWEHGPAGERSYNPTASLLGFLLKFAEPGSELYRTACALTQEAYGYFKKEFPLDSMHTVSCFVDLYEALKDCSANTLLDLEEFRALLSGQIQRILTYDTRLWATGYVCKPSFFIHSKASDFYGENRKICDDECEFISRTQNADGTWNITWSWPDYPEQWHISKNWWKSDWIIKNVRYYRAIRTAE